MFVDEELDAIEREREQKKQEQSDGTTKRQEADDTTEHGEKTGDKPAEFSVNAEDGATVPTIATYDWNSFTERMDDVKLKILQDASASDEKFVKTIKDNVKEAAVVNTEVEREREAFAKQSVQYEREKLSTKQQRNTIEATEDKWANREKRREFHYNGVKPIMEFVGISKPMNLALLYFLSFILVWFFLLSKLWRGTIGALIAGAEDANRPKTVKGFLWTLLGLVALGVLAALVYLFLKWQGII